MASALALDSYVNNVRTLSQQGKECSNGEVIRSNFVEYLRNICGNIIRVNVNNSECIPYIRNHLRWSSLWPVIENINAKRKLTERNKSYVLLK